MFTKKKRLISLLVWFLFLAGVYWGFGDSELTMPITVSYYVICLVLSIAYLLICGGLRPIMAEDRRREESTRKKYLSDQGKLHPIKRKDKFRRFRVKSGEEPEDEPLPPPPNIFKIPEEKRAVLSQVLLVAVIPFFLIFMIDLLYLNFFA